jgi:hypothetical protein
MRSSVLAILAVLVHGVPAFAADNPACAKYQEPLAYNACLARQGPAAHIARELPAARAQMGEARGFHGRADFRRARGGRSHAIFSVR